MKALKVILPALLLLGCSTPAPLQDKANHPTGLIGVRFHAATPGILLHDYAEKTGKVLELTQGLDTRTGSIVLRTEKPVTMPQYLEMIENKLAEYNIGIYPLGSNRIVAAWINPSKAPTPPKPTPMSNTESRGTKSYIERMRARRAETRPQPPQPPKYTGEELETHLQQYNMELIREAARSDATATPLPIPLTPEQEKGLEVLEMPLPSDNRRGGTASNIVIEAEPGKLLDAIREAVGIEADAPEVREQ